MSPFKKAESPEHVPGHLFLDTGASYLGGHPGLKNSPGFQLPVRLRITDAVVHISTTGRGEPQKLVIGLDEIVSIDVEELQAGAVNATNWSPGVAGGIGQTSGVTISLRTGYGIVLRAGAPVPLVRTTLEPVKRLLASRQTGWMPDPTGRHELRYWDGTVWTAHVSDAGAQSTDPI